MNKLARFAGVCLVLVTILGFAVAPVVATTNMGYYDQEDEPNDTTGTADPITTERLMRGAFPSTSDNYDYYSTYVAAGSSVYVQLSSIQTGCDYDLALLNSSGTQVAASANYNDIGEWISYTASSAGTYYIKVTRYSGSNAIPYRLYTQTSGHTFNHSYYINNVGDDNYMYWLGRDQANNLSGVVLLDFGIPVKNAGVYGITDLGNHYADMARVKTAVDKFIQGYNANPKHTSNIEVAVGLNNKVSPLYPLPATTAEYQAHGAAFKQMVTSIATSGHVTAVNAAIDAELDWNTTTLTRAWVDGFTQATGSRKLYNFGDHAGRVDDFSGEVNPVFNNGWTADDIWYISWGNSASYCIPEVYSTGNADEWTYQKKWAFNHSKQQYYDGVLSTNGWGPPEGLITNQQTYDAFSQRLQAQGLGETLESCSWIALSSQP